MLGRLSAERATDEVHEIILSVRKAAAHMRVHRTTTFRQRQRFLAMPCEVKVVALNDCPRG